MMWQAEMVGPVRQPLPHGRGSDVKSRGLNKAIRATPVREWLPEATP
jgi:hypothetical protein